MEIRSIYCRNCGKQVRAIRQEPNHILHLLITVFTLGFWLPVWFLVIVVGVMTRWRCQECGMVEYTWTHRLADESIDGLANASGRGAARMVNFFQRHHDRLVPIYLWTAFVLAAFIITMLVCSMTIM